MPRSANDGEYVVNAAADAVAVAMDRVTDPRAKLVGVQVMTVWRLPGGEVKIVGVTRER